jgi:FAD/FMN-containing dehydrogenase
LLDDGGVAEERLSRRTLVARGAAAGLALYLAACGKSTPSSTTTQLRKTRIRRAGGTPSLNDLRDAVRGRVIAPGAHGYQRASGVYNRRYDGARPLAVVQPRDAADVGAAVRWANRRDVRVLAKSGGHSYAGYSTGNGVLVVNLSSLASVKVNRGAGTADIEAGAQLIDVYTKLAAHGLTVPAGSCPSVGAGGHLLGGGFGLASRKLGLASDNVRALAIVTADGERRVADARREEDLFWACRGGGGGNFGITTKFTVKAHPVSHAAHFNMTFPWSEASTALDAWQRLIPHATQDITSVFHLSSAPAVSANGQYFGPESKLASLLAPLTAISGATLSTGTLDYAQLMLFWAGCSSLTESQCHTVGTAPGGTFPRTRFLAKSDYVSKRLDAAGRTALIEGAEARAGQPGSGTILLDSYGGKINEPAADHTAFVHRDELFSIQYLAYFPESGTHTAERWAEKTWRSMRHHVSGAAYQNYIDPRLDGWEKAYYGANYARLQDVKKRYDPDFRFRFAQAIRPT